MPQICTNRTELQVVHDLPPIPSRTQVPAPDPSPTPDFRRRDARSYAEQITGRARFLPRPERCLITAIYERGTSISDLATLAGQPARSLRREVHRILRRLTSPEFAFVALHMDAWPITMRRVAQACILEGVPVRQASRTLELSLHTVRKHRESIRTLAAGPSLDFTARLRSKAG